MEMTKLIDIHRRAHLVHAQIVAAQKLLHETGQADPSTVLDDNSPYFALLNKLYEEEYPLTKMLMASDIIIRAEGPATKDTPVLSLINSLFTGVEKQFRNLAKSILPLSLNDIRGALKKLDIRLTGMAPGSLYAGFAINVPSPLPLIATEEEDSAILTVKKAITNLAVVPGYIDKDRINPQLFEIIQDPAIRDITLVAAFNLAPTGRRGIHTLEITSPHIKDSNATEVTSRLTQIDRTTLMETIIKRPTIGKKKRSGEFVGKLRALDLDKTRVVLRNVPNIGSLMCILPLTGSKARQLIDKTVRVSGEYEMDESGVARLMFVDSVTPVDNLELPV